MINENLREIRGQEIAQLEGQINRVDDSSYRVKSQSGNGNYEVLSTEIGWLCSCPDHVYRGVKCKHVWAVEFSLKLREQVKENLVIQPLNSLTCVFCGSDETVKDAKRHNRYGNIQRYLCKACGKRFSINIGFEKMKASPQVITSAMQLYFTGESLRNAQKFLRLQGVNISHVAVYKWIGKYVSIMQKYLDQIKPKVSDTWRADELYLKIKGDMKYLFALMDDETRFWIAQEVADSKYTHNAQRLFKLGKQVSGKKPKTLITDGLQAYHDAYFKEFWTRKKETRTEHIQHISIRGDHNNNKMERMNGEVRDREKVMRGLKKEDTPILTGYQIFHNYIRPHEGLNGKTPAEACGMKIEGNNKWITIIQNASNHSLTKK
jgi:transposase-like protein